jgi:hypothetical protein
MSVEEISQVVRQRPFKPFVFHLDNGQPNSCTLLCTQINDVVDKVQIGEFPQHKY